MDDRNVARPPARWLAFALICGATLLAYARSFSVPFQFDDLDQILENQALHDFTWESILHWGRARILPYLTFALNWQIGGDNTVGYHAVNLIIHLGTVFFVFRLALTLCDSPRLSGSRIAERRLAVAIGAALLFACHPLQTQAVTYIVQRITSMCGFFYVGSVYAYAAARNRQSEGRRATGSYVASLLLAAGALLSKETAATLPITLLLVEWFFHPGSLRQKALLWLPFALLALAPPLIWIFVWRAPARVTRLTGPDATWLDNLLRAASPAGPISSFDYLRTQCTVIPQYLRLAILPYGLTVDHDVTVARTLSLPVLGGIALLAALLGIGFYARRRWPLLGFGIVWIFVTLAVESSFLPIADLMVEHRMYLPMAGLSIAAASLFAAAYNRRSMAIGAAVGVGAVLVALTMVRNEVWRTQLALWNDALAKSPGKARPSMNVGTLLHLEGKLDEAIPYYCKALEIEPDNARAKYNLHLALETRVEQRLEAGQPVDLVPDESGEGFVPRNPCEGPKKSAETDSRKKEEGERL